MEHSVTEDRLDLLAKHLVGQIGPKRFKAWFGTPENLCLAGNILTITVPNSFAANWIQAHYLQVIQQACQEVLGLGCQINIVIDPTRQDQADLRSTQPQQGPSPMRQLLTLENFVVGPSNQLAFNAAKALLRDGPSPFNPLFVHGGCGVGKTHLLQGICNELARLRPGATWLYMSAEEFANQFVTALRNRQLEQFRKKVRQLSLLAIDDIHFLANKPSTQEEFFHTFNTISLAGRQVVMASDAPPRQIRQMSAKLVNRFISGMVVEIEPPDLQTRYAICKQFAARAAKTLAGGKEGLEVPEVVLRYVAEHVTTNVRELEGAILRLLAIATLQHQPISRELARKALADHCGQAPKVTIDLARIEQAVADFFGLDKAAIRSSRRDRTTVCARQICMYMARRHTGLSYAQIGRDLGNRHHATCLLAIRKLEKAVAQDAEIHWHDASGHRMARARTVLEQIEVAIKA